MSLLSSLGDIVGKRRVITDAEALIPYSHDEYLRHTSTPPLVVLPDSRDEVIEIMKACRSHGVPVTPRGLGTGLAGGAVPLKGSVVLSLERMNRVVELDPEDGTITVEPGLIVEQLHKTVEEQGLFYPVDPASLDSCSIGGNVATNAGGPRALKYGVTRHYVLGAEAVLPDARLISHGGKYIKNTAGYDLSHALIGSEGTLCIFTGITLKLIPLPPARQDLLIPFTTMKDAAQAVVKILNQLRITPAVLEFMDHTSIKVAEKATEKSFPHSDAGAHLLIQLDGLNDEEVEQQMVRVGELCMELGAEDVMVAFNQTTRDRLWEARRILHEACNAASTAVEMQDVSVPRSQIPRLLEELENLGKRIEKPIACFGHAGDGNVHVSVLHQDEDPEPFFAALDEINGEVLSIANRLGGTISGEHGIGSVKKKYLKRWLGTNEMALMKALKRMLDPEDFLNPEKILD